MSDPTGGPALLVLIYCLVRLGRLDEARQTVQQMLTIWPQLTIAAYRRRSAFRAPVVETIIDLLRRAGLPE